MTSKFKLKLYITGRTPKSERTISNLYGICDEQLTGQCEIEIIDVLEHPQVAEDRKIMAAPTLIRELPGFKTLHRVYPERDSSVASLLQNGKKPRFRVTQ